MHANGGCATKHAFGVYTATPPAAFVFEHVTDVDRRPRPVLGPDWAGPVEIEAATVLYDRDGSAEALAMVRADEARGVARSSSPDLVERVTTKGLAGERGARTTAGELSA